MALVSSNYDFPNCPPSIYLSAQLNYYESISNYRFKFKFVNTLTRNNRSKIKKNPLSILTRLIFDHIFHEIKIVEYLYCVDRVLFKKFLMSTENLAISCNTESCRSNIIFCWKRSARDSDVLQ